MLHALWKRSKFIPIFTLFLVFGMVFSPCLTNIQAAGIVSPPGIIVNGQTLHSDVDPLIENDRILIPARAVSETLGARVEWQPSEQMITIERGETLVTLWIGNTRALKGNTELILDAAPRIINGRTMVPLRFVSEALGAQVEWRPDSREAIITLIAEETPQDTVNNQPDISTAPGSYDQPGTYGPATGQEEVTGDVNINANNVTLQNQIINGDLTIGGTAPGARSSISAAASGPAWLPVPGSGSGTVNVDNVNVRGAVYINGGSATHIVLNDFTCNELCVNDPSGIVQIDISGNSTVPLARLQSGAVLEEKELIGGGSGFKEIMITAPSGAQIKLSGLFSQVVCNGPGVKIQLLAGNVKELIIESAASGSSVNIGGSSSVGRCTVNGSASLAGTGRVETIDVYAEGTVRYLTLQVGSTNSGSGLQTVSDSEKIRWSKTQQAVEYIASDTSSSGPPLPPPAPLVITAAGGEDQVPYNGSLLLTTGDAGTTWAITNYEGGGATLSTAAGGASSVLGPADPAGSGAGSSGRCVVTASRGGSSVQYTVYIQGNGTQTYPYIIRNGAGLTAMRNNADPGNVNIDGLGHDISGYTANKFYKMVADVSLAAYQPWIPIGMADNFPSGGTVDGTEYLRFNGYGHHITNLAINTALNRQGLFSYIFVNSGQYHLKNLVIDAPSVTCTSNQAGGLVGMVDGTIGQIRISGVAVIGGSVSGTSETAGLIGSSTNTAISNCYTSCTVTGNGGSVGGLAGYVYAASPGATISNCYATGTVTNGTSNTGGLVGYLNGATAQILNSYAAGNVSGTGSTGGLLGNNVGSSVTNCFARGNITGTGATSHRMVGSNTGTLTNNHALDSATVNGSTVAPGSLANSVEGADVSSATSLTAAFYTVTLGWASPPWNIADGSYPTL